MNIPEATVRVKFAPDVSTVVRIARILARHMTILADDLELEQESE